MTNRQNALLLIREGFSHLRRRRDAFTGGVIVGMTTTAFSLSLISRSEAEQISNVAHLMIESQNQ